MIGPTFRRVTVMVANATADPLFDADWQFRRLPFDAVVQIIDITTAASAGLLRQVVLGSDNQGQEAPVTVGGTAGVFDNNRDNADEYIGAAGDQIRIIYREVLGGTPSVMTVVRLQPLVG